MLSKIPPVWLGISIGTFVCGVLGWTYIVFLHEPGSVFYLFAGLTFFGAPIIGGVVAAMKTQTHKLQAFFRPSSAVFGVAFVMFIVTYAVFPQSARTSVQLPDSCNGFDGSFDPPSNLVYTLPNGDIGILIISDQETAVVAQVDYEHPPYPSTVFFIDKKENNILQSISFNNDVISATINNGVVYIFNDKLGSLFDARTGMWEETILIIDNYGGLSESDRPFFSRASSGHWYMETTAIISSWHIDGTVLSRPHLTFNGIARGCFISGDTQTVIRY
jgi:hypothetical protein